MKLSYLRGLLLTNVAVCVILIAGITKGNAQSGSNGLANVQLEAAKAYKTLNFGDNSEAVDKKMAEIVGEGSAGNADYVDFNINYDETFWRSLFKTDAEYGPYKYDPTTSSQSDKVRSLMNYFSGFRIAKHVRGNSVISLICYQLYDTVSGGGSLAVVSVTYKIFDAQKLIEGFVQSYPNARKEDKSYKFENTTYPGIFIEFHRTFFVDVNQDRSAILSIPTGKFTFSFTEPGKFNKDQLDTWNGLMAQNKQTNLNVYFESVKTSFLELAKEIDQYEPSEEDAKMHGDPNLERMDCLTYQGWYYNGLYESIIYGPPNAVFASRKILDPIMGAYFKSIAAEKEKAKAQLKKEVDTSTGF